MRITAARRCRARPHARAFTLIETMIVVLIIGILASLAFVVLGKVMRSSREAAQRANLVSLRNAIEQFKQEFDSLRVPLVNDAAPVNANRQPNVRDAAFLRNETFQNEPRYSTLSLTYYLIGALEADVDGAAGPGFTKPMPDGTFSRRGRRYDPFFDLNRNPEMLSRDAADPDRIELLDRWKNPIRFYRWAPSFFTSGPNAGRVDNYNTPLELDNPNGAVELRSAEYALVSLGADGEINPGAFIDPLNRDNIVEFGR